MKVMGPVGGLKLGKLGGIANKMVSAGKEGGLAGDLMGKASSLVGEKSGDLMGKASSLVGEKSGDLMGKASSLVGEKSGDLMGKASSLVGEKSGDLMGQASAGMKMPLSVPTKVGFAPKQVRQHGGGQEPLSTESQIFGAVTVALISGGVIKSLVDYLIAE